MQGFSSTVVVFGRGAKCAKSLCPAALTYDRVINRDPVSALEIPVGGLQPPWPQRSCAVTVPAGMVLEIQFHKSFKHTYICVAPKKANPASPAEVKPCIFLLNLFSVRTDAQLQPRRSHTSTKEEATRRVAHS